ncbi:DUF4760 domain-containing protein [Empedobacter falsenii]
MSQINFFQKRLSIRLLWFSIAALLVLFILAFLSFKYLIGLSIKDSFDYTSKLVIAVIAFFTFIYHLHNMELQIKAQQKSNEQNLAKYTYDICSDFRKPIMMNINEDLRILLNEHEKDLEKGDITNFLEFIEKDENKHKRKALILTLNYFESISAMVQAGDLDDEIVKRLFGKLFGRYYEILRPYIKYRQKEASKSWCNFEKIAKKWIEDEKMH